MDTTEILIIGAGIAGASLAWQLARQGRQVTCIEREKQLGYHSTGRSAAIFMESYGPKGIRALTRASRQFYLQPPPGFAETDILHPRQVVYVATSGQQGLVRAMQASRADSGIHLRLLDHDQLLRMVPALKPDLFENALQDGNGYDIEVDALLQGFVRGARNAGARLHMNTQVLSADFVDDQWQLDLSDGQKMQARIVVDAAGAWADEVAGLFGVDPIHLQPCRRSALTFKASEGLGHFEDWPMVVDIGEQWYFKPDAGQFLASPANADPVPAHDVQPEELDIATAIYRVQEASILQIERPSSTWAGLRSFVPDGEIVIGFEPGRPDFFWLAAQGGYGIQSAYGASLLAACLLDGQPLPPELTDYGVDPEVVSPQRLR